MALSDLMTAFAEEVGLPDIELEEDGGARLVLGDDLEIDVFADVQGQGFSVIGVVGVLPDADREAAFQWMLAANVEGLGTGGAFLGFDPQRDEIVLRRHFPNTELAVSQFDRELAAFANALQTCRVRNDGGALGRQDDEAPPEEDDALQGPPSGIMV